MTHAEHITQEGASPRETDLPFGHYCRYKLSTMRCRIRSLGKQSLRLGRWLESDVFPAASQAGHEVVHLEARPEGVIRLEPKEGMDTTLELTDCHELCAFLERIAIRSLELETRLESNQIVDVLMFLYTYRRALSPRHDGSKPATGVGGQLLSDHGVHFCCTQIRVRDQALMVEYSYCVTRLSQLVRWFERKHLHFSDHRALFHAAPRYGALAVALSLAVLLAFVLTNSLQLLIVAALVQGAVLFAAVYLFFRGMGSIEYDNEEKAYRLARAHADLTRHAARIHDDLASARTVQRKLLPDPRQMPLAETLEWISSFAPETEVGGDYFDAAQLGDHKAAMVFADVSGHGMAAALITVIVKMAFRSWVEGEWSLGDFARRVNRDLCQFTPDSSFVVLVAAIYDHANERLDFVNCGHAPEPFHLPADLSQPVVGLPRTGSMLLGLEDYIEVHEAALSLAPGDAILLATDGLTEAMNDQGELYGDDRLVEFLTTHRSKPVADLVASLVEDVSRFVGTAQQSDDRTVLAFRVRGG